MNDVDEKPIYIVTFVYLVIVAMGFAYATAPSWSAKLQQAADNRLDMAYESDVPGVIFAILVLLPFVALIIVSLKRRLKPTGPPPVNNNGKR